MVEQLRTRLRAPAAPLVWPLALGAVGGGMQAVTGFHAWLVLPALGLAAGLACAVVHGGVLLALHYRHRRRTARQPA